MNAFEQLARYFAYPFVRYALAAAVLAALCASLLGVTLVLKRFSFIGDGLSHVAFGALAAATAAGLTDNMLLVLPVTVIAAVLLLRAGQGKALRGDASLAMLSAGSMAFGYLLLSKFSPSANVAGDVCGTLFGSASILTLRPLDLVFCVGLAIVVLAFFLLCYNKVFALTFDEDFFAAAGANAGGYNLLIAVVVALVVVMAMKLVGTLLISALVVFPALCAMRVCRSFRAVTLCSAAISVVCAVLGTLLSMLLETPVGATIVAADAAAYGICRVVGAVRGR